MLRTIFGVGLVIVSCLVFLDQQVRVYKLENKVDHLNNINSDLKAHNNYMRTNISALVNMVNNESKTQESYISVKNDKIYLINKMREMDNRVASTNTQYSTLEQRYSSLLANYSSLQRENETLRTELEKEKNNFTKIKEVIVYVPKPNVKDTIEPTKNKKRSRKK
jgi:regulator of replication initiation timing